MSPSTQTSGSSGTRCADSYRALYESCRDEALERRPAHDQLSELARLVSDFVLCARGAHLRSDAVLADLRMALEPVVERGQVSVPTLIERAIKDFYQAL
jgi:hypothetical protein